MSIVSLRDIVRLYGVRINVSASTSGDIIGVNSTTGFSGIHGNIFLYDCSIQVSNSGAGTASDVTQSGSGTLSVSPATVFTTSSGTITPLAVGPVTINGPLLVAVGIDAIG